jgi:hypothetical protein
MLPSFFQARSQHTVSRLPVSAVSCLLHLAITICHFFLFGIQHCLVPNQTDSFGRGTCEGLSQRIPPYSERPSDASLVRGRFTEGDTDSSSEVSNDQSSDYSTVDVS